MKRREFIKVAAPVAAMPIFMNGFSINAIAGDSPLLKALATSFITNDHVLVLIQLNGGNDGLNTVLPLDQYSNLSKVRANILIAENKALKLDGTDATALHPAMTGMRSLYDSGQIAIVHDVGYPDPNFSHFRATDIWLTGSDSDVVLNSGWAGRFLDDEYSDYPTGYPNTSMPDPLAIQIGSIVSPALQGPNVSMGMAITSATDFYNLLAGTTDPTPNTPAGHELSFIRLVADQTQKYTAVIKNAAAKASNKSALWPSAGQNPLADQMKIVSQLIAGGLKTRIYVVNLGSFDTHAAQVDTADVTTGNHANLLGKLSQAITAFQDDLKLLNSDQRVLGMTFSEFGRRIVSNASLGTDHGAAAPLFFFGSQLNGGIYGDNPTIGPHVTVNDNIPMQYDFRAMYATILRDWFGVDEKTIQDTLLHEFQSLNILNAGSSPKIDISCYPNPFDSQTNIKYFSDGRQPLLIQIFDAQGRLIQTLLNSRQPYGSHTLSFNGSSLLSGNYYCRIQTGSAQKVASLIKL